MRVKLAVDLTEYDSRCVTGSEGHTSEPCSFWARGSDRFTGVRFDNGARLDVLWRSLEIIDPEALAEMKKHQEELEAGAASAASAELREGPRGGFKSLSFQYSGGSYGTHSREQADKLLDIMRKNNVPIIRKTA